MGFKNRQSLIFQGTLLILFAGIVFWLYIRCWNTEAIGFLHDDGIYAITAKALAEGRGLTLLNLPGTPAEVKYPILYPLILSVGWLIQPNFPDNIPTLLLITLLFTPASLILTWIYFHRQKGLPAWACWVLLGIVASSFYFMFYATLLMSEMPYLFFSLAALFMADKLREKNIPQNLVWLILFSILSFHIRTIGVTLIAAIALWLWRSVSRKQALIYTLSTLSLTVLPWFVWIKTHAPNHVSTINYPLAYVYGGYGLEYLQNASSNPAILIQQLVDQGLMPYTDALLNLMFPWLVYALAPYHGASFFVALGLLGVFILLGIRALRQRTFSAMGLYVVFYSLAIVVWMYANQMVRFLDVIQPFLWAILFSAILSATQKNPAGIRIAAPALLLLAVLALAPAQGGYNLLVRIRSQHDLEPSGRYRMLWPEYQGLFQAIRQHTPPNATIGGIWDPLFYLYTNRPGFVLFPLALKPVNQRITEESLHFLAQSLQAYHVQYVVAEPLLLNQEFKAPSNPVVDYLLKQNPDAFHLEYSTPSGLIRLYRIQAGSQLK